MRKPAIKLPSKCSKRKKCTNWFRFSRSYCSYWAFKILFAVLWRQSWKLSVPNCSWNDSSLQIVRLVGRNHFLFTFNCVYLFSHRNWNVKRNARSELKMNTSINLCIVNWEGCKTQTALVGVCQYRRSFPVHVTDIWWHLSVLWEYYIFTIESMDEVVEWNSRQNWLLICVVNFLYANYEVESIITDHFYASNILYFCVWGDEAVHTA